MNYPRREFLKLASSLGTGVVLTGIANKLGGCNTVSKITESNKVFGLQLYTLRNEMPKDPKGVLKQVASFGYKQIESYEHDKLGMFWGMTNTEFKKYMDELGMRVVASHCSANDFERKANEVAQIGIEYLILPDLNSLFQGKSEKDLTIDQYKQAAARLNQLGEISAKAGLRIGYHNHQHTFIQKQGQFPQDILMQNTDANLVDYEMDIYWVVTAGQDPVQWLNKYPNRFTLSHVKDRKKGVPSSNTDASTVVGSGQINFEQVLNVADKRGMKYFIVEQERYDGTTPIKAVQQNAEYLKKLDVLKK